MFLNSKVPFFKIVLCFLALRFRRLFDVSRFQNFDVTMFLMFLGSEVHLFQDGWCSKVRFSEEFLCFLAPRFQRFFDISWFRSSTFSKTSDVSWFQSSVFVFRWCFLVLKFHRFLTFLGYEVLFSIMFDASWLQSFKGCPMFIGSNASLFKDA